MLMCAGPGKWGCGKGAVKGLGEGGRAIVGQFKRLIGKGGSKEAPIVPTARKAEQEAASHARDLCSFSGETLVLMADGSKKPISQIKVGDKVLATNPLSGTQSARRVTRVWVHQDRVIRLNVAGEVLVTTEDHPFWNATDHAWERADGFDRGDRVGMASGGTAKYRGLVGRFRRATAYNLTVQGVHTYHVGHHALLVHNNSTCTISKVAPDWATKGAHIHVNGFELAVRPGAGGSIVFKPVFATRAPAALQRAQATAQEALKDPRFREQLIRDVTRGRDYLGSSNLPGARAKSGELNFLLKALQKVE
jgi:hypothetical protein